MHTVAIQSARGRNGLRVGIGHQDCDWRSSSTCFPLAVPGVTESPREVVRLSAGHAAALAELLQVLSCGEESAALTFDHLGNSWRDLSLSWALGRIAADEREHHGLLTGLRASLPQPRLDPSLEATMRRFFMRLADRDIMVHCVRIVAIDCAVCRVLAMLRCRRKPLASDLRVGSILKRIHQDEARHVAIASRCATPLIQSVRGREIAADALEQLTKVLRLRADSLDSLEVHPDQLFARLRAIPWRLRSFDAR
jgi:hypothetical protein